MSRFRTSRETRNVVRFPSQETAEPRSGTGHAGFAFEQPAQSGKAFRRLKPREIVAPTAAEVGAVLEVCRRDKGPLGLRDLALFVLMAQSGLRVSEALAVTVGQVRGARGIRERVVLRPEDTKGGIGGEVILPRSARRVLGRWLGVRGGLGEEPLFPGPRGGRLTVRAAEVRWRRRQEEAGADRLHVLHGLRHFFCQALYERTRDIALVASMARHSSPAVTSRYYAGPSARRIGYGQHGSWTHSEVAASAL